MSDDVIDRLWEQIEPVVYITREQFVRGLAEWDIEAIRIDGHLAFVTLTQGPEFHFTSFDTKAPITPGLIRRCLAPIIDRRGFVTTRTPKAGADRQHRFNKILGFQVVGDDEFFLHYRLEPKCP